MDKLRIWMGACLLAVAPIHMAYGQTASTSRKVSESASVKRGEYLIEKVGMCADCHTPFNEKGEPVMEKHLQGATLMFKPTVPPQDG
jgi:cytochrome c553